MTTDGMVKVGNVGPWARAGSDPTEDEAKVIKEVQDVAFAYQAGEMPLDVALATQTPRRRALTMQFTRPGTDRWMAMCKLLDDAVKAQPGVWLTPNGIVTEVEMREGWGRKLYEGGVEKGIEFACAISSDGRPIYRTEEQRGPRKFQQNHQGLSTFGTAIDVEQADIPWYDRTEAP